MLMDYMKEIKEISAEQAIILWQASRLSLSKIYEKAPEILKVQGSVIGTLGNFSASIGKAKSKKTFNVSAIVAAALKTVRYCGMVRNYRKKKERFFMWTLKIIFEWYFYFLIFNKIQ